MIPLSPDTPVLKAAKLALEHRGAIILGSDGESVWISDKVRVGETVVRVFERETKQ